MFRWVKLSKHYYYAEVIENSYAPTYSSGKYALEREVFYALMKLKKNKKYKVWGLQLGNHHVKKRRRN